MDCPGDQTFFDLPANDQAKLLKALLGIIRHFFGDLNALLADLTDPRSSTHVLYPLPALVLAGILMYLFHLGARRQVKLKLHTLPSVVTFGTLFRVARVPHGDTLNDAFMFCDPEDFQQVICRMINALIRKKVLYPCRLLDRYFVVAVDATGTLTFSKRHCPHCLTQTQNGKTTYYHKVLEAKLVGPNGFAISLMSEFIENPGEQPKKQDCELKAFYRLAPRLKRAFPRLPILLTLDGLYACGPVFDICTNYEWRFMVVLTDKDLPSVNQHFQVLSALQSYNHMSIRTGKNLEIGQEFRWVDQICYIDSDKRQHALHVLECIETKPDKQGQASRSTWKWVTNLKLSKTNVVEVANDGGRSRWTIENQGFNTQKTGGYRLEHAYTTNPNAAKIFYYLLQIAHTIAQLLYKGSLLGKSRRKSLGALKNLADRLLEAWRNVAVTEETMDQIIHWRFQIRFCPDTS